MKREYSKHGDVLVFKFHVSGFSQAAIDEFVHEVVSQGERSEYHPEAIVVQQDVEQLDVDAERRAFADAEADRIDVDADGYDLSESNYDPDEDRTP